MKLAAVKRWPGWLLLLGVTVALLLVGTLRDQGPRSENDRIDSISRRVACPVCSGESVFESRNAASTNIANKIADLVREGQLSDAEIIASIQKDSAVQLLLVPRRTGFDALAWALPVAAGTVAFVGLGIAFRRWARREDDVPTDDDRAIVEAARAAGSAASGDTFDAGRDEQ
ncbi:MAG: cytochrome c biosis protein CcmH [Actinomycetota bacterium]